MQVAALISFFVLCLLAIAVFAYLYAKRYNLLEKGDKKK